MNDTRTLHVERSTSTAHRLTHYDGVCGNIHGHNMKWEAEVTVSMEDAGESNMPLDLKEVADTIDEVDHAILLNRDDPLYEAQKEYEEAGTDLLGEVIVFEEGDPTCEVLARWMARRIYETDPAVEHVNLEVAETDKYAISSAYGEYDEMKEAVEDDE